MDRIARFTKTISPWTLLVLFSVPKAWKATKGFIGKTKPIDMMPAMKATAQTNTQFGFYLSLVCSFIIGYNNCPEKP